MSEGPRGLQHMSNKNKRATYPPPSPPRLAPSMLDSRGQVQDGNSMCMRHVQRFVNPRMFRLLCCAPRSGLSSSALSALGWAGCGRPSCVRHCPAYAGYSLHKDFANRGRTHVLWATALCGCAVWDSSSDGDDGGKALGAQHGQRMAEGQAPAP